MVFFFSLPYGNFTSSCKRCRFLFLVPKLLSQTNAQVLEFLWSFKFLINWKKRLGHFFKFLDPVSSIEEYHSSVKPKITGFTGQSNWIYFFLCVVGGGGDGEALNFGSVFEVPWEVMGISDSDLKLLWEVFSSKWGVIQWGKRGLPVLSKMGSFWWEIVKNWLWIIKKEVIGWQQNIKGCQWVKVSWKIGVDVANQPGHQYLLVSASPRCMPYGIDLYLLASLYVNFLSGNKMPHFIQTDFHFTKCQGLSHGQRFFQECMQIVTIWMRNIMRYYNNIFCD